MDCIEIYILNIIQLFFAITFLLFSFFVFNYAEAGTPDVRKCQKDCGTVDLENELEDSEIPSSDIENKNLEALRERTEDWSEVIAEDNIVQKAITDENVSNDTEEVESSEVEVE